MKAKLFIGLTPLVTVDNFNEWAKGKALTKDVIIHSIVTPADKDHVPDLMIIVYYPEGSPFDTEA